MKQTAKRITALVLAATMAVSVTMGGALAYSTADFNDVPAGNWAYEPVMKMADAGVIKGIAPDTFAPEVKVSPAMWLTLVGRAVYEADVKAAATAEDNWYSAYVRVAENKGLLDGTAIDKATIEGEMTRYDMAATLYGAVKLMGVKDTTADTSKVPDYGDIPNKYIAAVAQVYAAGLITGKDGGKFAGMDTMRRDEAAAVMDRLITLKTTTEATPAEPEKPAGTIPPRTGEMETVTVTGTVYWYAVNSNEQHKASGADIVFCYKDGRELGRTVADADGKFTLTTTIDKADYDAYTYQYYIAATYADGNGGKWSNIHLQGEPNLEQLYNVKRGWNVEVNNDPQIYKLDF